MNAELRQIAQWLSTAQRAVAFTGAGISTESGIPDFRSPGGVWAKYRPVEFRDFMQSAEARYEYWRQKHEGHADFLSAAPNAGHRTLAAWEARGNIRGVITQNIDELHQQAGSARVLELHGTARRAQCLDCGHRCDVEPLMAAFARDDAVPPCPTCGGRIKSATVSFGQTLPPAVLHEAFAWSRQADLFLAIGSSLVVEPAASLPRVASQHGARLVIINRDPTPLDNLADVVVRESIGAVLEHVERERGILARENSPVE